MTRKRAVAVMWAISATMIGAYAAPSFAAPPSQQTPYEFRASKLIGLKVFNHSTETLGNIDDIIFSAEGAPASVILNVGGFLGVGTKYVAVPFKTLQIKRDSENIRIVTEGSQNSLKALPDYQYYPALMRARRPGEHETGTSSPLTSPLTQYRS